MNPYFDFIKIHLFSSWSPRGVLTALLSPAKYLLKSKVKNDIIQLSIFYLILFRLDCST
jgi:hypothetical protein